MTFSVTGKVMWIITFLAKEIFTFIQVDKCLSERKHTIHERNYFCCYFFTVVKFHILSEDYSKVQSALSCIYDSVLGLDEKNSLLKIAITTNSTPMLKKMFDRFNNNFILPTVLYRTCLAEFQYLCLLYNYVFSCQ